MEHHMYKFKNRIYQNRLQFYWRVFDDTFMKPWLIRNYDPDTHKMNRRLKFKNLESGKLTSASCMDADKSKLRFLENNLGESLINNIQDPLNMPFSPKLDSPRKNDKAEVNISMQSDPCHLLKKNEFKSQEEAEDQTKSAYLDSRTLL